MASCLSISSATALCPFLAAKDSGVRPSMCLSNQPRHCSLCGSSSFTTSSYPSPAAHKSSVRPPLSFELVLTSFCASSSFTTASCPTSKNQHNGLSFDVQESGIRPLLSFKSASTSLCASSGFTTDLCLSLATPNAGSSVASSMREAGRRISLRDGRETDKIRSVGQGILSCREWTTEGYIPNIAY
jgi:hypothetical protein